MSRKRALLFALLAAAVDVFAVQAWWRVREARRALIDVVRALGEQTFLFHAFPKAEDEARPLAIAGAFVLLAALVALGAVVVKAWRRARPLSWVPAVVSTSMLALAGGAVALGAYGFMTYREGCADPVAIEPIRYDAFAAGALPHDIARVAVVVALALSTALILVLALRAPAARAPRLFGPAVMFAIGLVAFAATRAEGDDARHPPALLDATWRAWLHDPALRDLPPAESGCVPGAGYAPAVAASAKGVFVDGISIENEAALAATLGRYRELWRLVHEPQIPFPGNLEAVFVASMPMAKAKPLLVAASAAGYPTIYLIEAVPNPRLSTRTLGEVGYQPRACRLRLPPATELPDTGTWGELARAEARKQRAR